MVFVLLAAYGWCAVVDVAQKHNKDPKAASDAIVAEARKQWQVNGGGYIDDITAVVMHIDHD